MPNIFCHVTENGLQLDFPTARVQWVHSSGYSYYGFLRGLTLTKTKMKKEEVQEENKAEVHA